MDEFILNFVTDADVSINFEYSIVGEILGETGQVILAALILVLVLLLIIFDVSLFTSNTHYSYHKFCCDLFILSYLQVVHRTVAAIIGSTAALGVLSMLNKVSIGVPKRL